jgi:hypothetical protein
MQRPGGPAAAGYHHLRLQCPWFTAPQPDEHLTATHLTATHMRRPLCWWRAARAARAYQEGLEGKVAWAGSLPEEEGEPSESNRLFLPSSLKSGVGQGGDRQRRRHAETYTTLTSAVCLPASISSFV